MGGSRAAAQDQGRRRGEEDNRMVVVHPGVASNRTADQSRENNHDHQKRDQGPGF